MPMIDDNDVQDDLDGLEAEPATCELCGGELMELGPLGCLMHLRCRACGMQYSRPIDGCGD